MRRIALEEHFVLDSAEHLERSMALAPNVPRDAPNKMRPMLIDLGEGRLEAMAEAGVDFAVLSNVGIAQGMLDATTAMRLAREANDRLAEAIGKHLDKFGGSPRFHFKMPRQVPTNSSGPSGSWVSRVR